LVAGLYFTDPKAALTASSMPQAPIGEAERQDLIGYLLPRR
jgi:hypothetical protein